MELSNLETYINDNYNGLRTKKGTIPVFLIYKAILLVTNHSAITFNS